MNPWSLSADEAVSSGTTSQEMIEFLKGLVLLRKNVVVAGDQDTGKTSFLSLLSTFIPPDRLLISIEETAELDIQHRSRISLLSRPAEAQGGTPIPMPDLVKKSLDMRADYTIVGECRGEEAADLLQAMRRDRGFLIAVRAHTPADAISQLADMSRANFPVNQIIELLGIAPDVFVQLKRFHDGQRRATYVTENIGRDGSKILTKDIFRFIETTADDGYFTATDYVPSFFGDFERYGIRLSKKFFISERTKRADDDDEGQRPAAGRPVRPRRPPPTKKEGAKKKRPPKED